MVTTNFYSLVLVFMDALMGNAMCIAIIIADKHCAINSYSRKIIWLEVCPTNKDSRVVAGYYLCAVENFGKHIIIATTHGGTL